MLKSLKVKNLTVFAEANLRFSPQLNVFVGENGSGKSHLLKVAYAVLAASAEEGRKPDAPAPTKALLQSRLASKLVAVLRPESLGRLARRQPGLSRCDVQCGFQDRRHDVEFHFAAKSQAEVVIDKAPRAWQESAPVFLPTRELLTIFPGFVPLYESRFLEFEETWRDTCLLLGAPALRGPGEKRGKELLHPIEIAMGGSVELDKNGRFYLRTGEGRIEMALVAEGLRKLAMLARLIATGSLLEKGYLFWDEPETNLNPRLIKDVARTILRLCHSGIQVFLATHSLFLMRELDIQLQCPEVEGMTAQFFGMQPGTDGFEVEQGESVDEIGAIASLDEELSQSDRYLAAEG